MRYKPTRGDLEMGDYLVGPDRQEIVAVRKPSVKRGLWGDGPWQAEPDLVTWRYRGIACMVNRNDSLGNLNGYVGVPATHPWHGQDRDKVQAEAHGGITFSKPGADDGLWWVGFDCGHYLDVIPHMVANGFPYDGASVYRDISYVMLEVESLARQALEAVK